MNRECGDCSVCCITAPVHELNKQEYEVCKYLVRGHGCMIYDQKPHACDVFRCSWLEGEIPKKKLRPNECGVCFETTFIIKNDGSHLTILIGAVFNPVKARNHHKLFLKMPVRGKRIVSLAGQGLDATIGFQKDVDYYNEWLRATKKNGGVTIRDLEGKEVFFPV